MFELFSRQLLPHIRRNFVKALFALMALVSMAQVFAKDTATLKKGDLGLYHVTASVESVEEACPADSHLRCVVGGQKVTLKVPLKGCLDRLSGYFTTFSHDGDKTTINFSGVAVATEASTTARCYAAPIEKVVVMVAGYNKVQVKNLNGVEGTKAIVSGDVALTSASAKIISVKPICPPPAPGRFGCMAIGSVVTLDVALNGCVDKLGTYATSFDVIGGQQVLTFAGVNVGSKLSLTARCIKAPSERVTITIPSNDKPKLVNLDFTAQ